ncbi:glycosyl hydrolase family 61-domain-containing protein [Xylariaceae sp. FL0594]|nr:glycosyl hydrolase family 61-domain-containing protein [Xylariaceae sp. FL0594]
MKSPLALTLPLTLALALLTSLAHAHGVFSTIFINGVSQGDRKCLRTSFTLDKITSPITDLDSPDMACGIAGSTPAADTCSIEVGAKLSFEFRLWASGTLPGTIDGSHLGPMAIYAKRVSSSPGSVTRDGNGDGSSGSGWFKLWESGYDEKTSTWATQKLIANDGIVSLQIPAGFPAGDYLMRPEIIALHNLAAGPAQFYVGCAQIRVSGSSSKGNGDVVPADKMVSIPGYIKASDPAVNFNSHPDAPKHFPYILGGPPAYVFPGGEQTDEFAFSPLEAPPPPLSGKGDGTTDAPTTASGNNMATPTADDEYSVTTATTSSSMTPTQNPTAATTGPPSSGSRKCRPRRRSRGIPPSEVWYSRAAKVTSSQSL